MGNYMRLERRSAARPHVYLTVAVQEAIAELWHATERTVQHCVHPCVVRTVHGREPFFAGGDAARPAGNTPADTMNPRHYGEHCR